MHERIRTFLGLMGDLGDLLGAEVRVLVMGGEDDVEVRPDFGGGANGEAGLLDEDEGAARCWPSLSVSA